jgi:hypothetical protein
MQMSGARLSALPAMGGVVFLFTTQRTSALDETAEARARTPRRLRSGRAARRRDGHRFGPQDDDRDPASTTWTSAMERASKYEPFIRTTSTSCAGALRSDTTAMADHHRCPALGGSDGAGQGRASHEQSSRR